MNSKVFLKTACNILFSSIDVAIETELNEDGSMAAKKVRSNTISKYLKNGKCKPYSPKAKNIFLKRVRYNIFPEEFQLNSSETEIKVFLHKCIYLLSTLFNLNFCFLKSDDFEEYRKNVYYFVEKFTDLFSKGYELEQEDIRSFILIEFCRNMNSKNLFTKDDIDEYLLDLGKINAATHHLPKKVRDENFRSMYNDSINYLTNCKDFFECLFINDNGNIAVYRASKRFYRKFCLKYDKKKIKNIWKKIDFKYCYWKDSLIELIFDECITFSTGRVLGYMVNVAGSNHKILNLINDFETFTMKCRTPEAYNIFRKYTAEIDKQTLGEKNDADKYDKIIDKNIFITNNKYYSELYRNLQKTKKYNIIKKTIYMCLNVELEP